MIVLNKSTKEELYNETYLYKDQIPFDVTVNDEIVSFTIVGNSMEERFTYFQIGIKNKQTELHSISLWVIE